MSSPVSEEAPGDIAALADWRRRISELYAAVRHDDDPRIAWERWCTTRHELFVSHPQSPLPEAARDLYGGPFVYPYDPEARCLARLEPIDPVSAIGVGTSDGRELRMVRAARATFDVFGERATLDVFWLDQYGGGIYLASRDATSGTSTYGGGRYLLDTAKGADLGAEGERLVLDFNFAYQPSCSYDPRWSCPLPVPENTIPFAVPAGERSSGP